MGSTAKNSIVFICITVCLDSIGIGIILPVMPELLKEVSHIGVAEAAFYGGLLAASYAVMQFMFGPLLGSLSDRYGRRPILLAGLICLSLDYLIMGFAQSFLLLLIGRIVAGIAGSTYVVASAYIADVSAPEKRAERFGLVGAAFGLGFILGPVIGGLLGQFGTRVPFFAAALVALVNLLYGYCVLPETLKPANRRTFSWAKSNPFSGLLLIKGFPSLGWVLLAFFAFQVGNFVYPAIWAFWGQHVLSWSAFEVGMSLALVGIGYAVAQGWLVGVLVPKVGEVRVVYVGLVICIVALCFYAFVTSPLLVYLFIPVAATGALVTPAISGIMSNAVSEDEQGLLQGVISGLMAIASIVSPVCMGGLFYLSTNETSSWQFPGASFVLAAIITAGALYAFRTGINERKSINSDAIREAPANEPA